MKEFTIKSEDSLNLRQRALEIYQINNNTTIGNTSDLNKLDILKLFKELELSQIEVELQNEELLLAKIRTKLAKTHANSILEKYTEFYEFASLGYIMINETGKVIDINQTACLLLDKDKSNLINKNLIHCLSENDKAVFNTFLINIFLNRTTNTCFVSIIKKDKDVTRIKISGSVLNNHNTQCHLKLTNYTLEEQTQKENFEKDFFYKETQRVGNIVSYKINITANVWQSSEALNLIFGFEKDTIFNFESWLDLIHPDDRNEMRLYLEDKIKNNASFNKEYRIIRKSDGETRWIDGRGEFNINNKSQETTLFGVIQDITERKLSIEKIKNAEIRSHRIFESSKEGILILDAISGKITDANPFLIEMIGFSYNELVGKELWEIGVFKNIAASKEAFIELQTKEYIRFEDMPLETKAGKSIDVEFVSIVYMVEQQRNVLCHIRDISDRKKVDQALQESSQLYFAMFEKNLAVQLLINPENGKIEDANSAAAKFYGYTLEQFKSMNLSDISTFPPEQILKEVEKLRLADQSYFQFLHKLACGETREVEIYTSQLLIGGQVLLISTINDITERKLEKDRLVLLNHQLKEVNILKSQFISTVSHEFRTPLAGILSSVQLLKIYNDTWDKEKKEKMYKQIFDAVQHTKSLLDDVSLIDEEQNSKSFFRPTDIQLISLIKEIIEENLAISETKHKIILSTNLTLESCYMDPIMIRHILNNLLSNAIKYSHESKEIKIFVDEINTNEIKIIIEDQGIGIPSEEIKYLLEPFYRASNTGIVKGTGFGMSIVKRFVELHKGQIFIESVIKEGTKVTIILPYKL